MYTHADTPTGPKEFIGTIQNISDDATAQADVKAIASLNWSLPDNQDGTVIDYYEVILIGTHTNSTMSVCMTDQSLQTLSYKFVLSEGNYTAASITAVDLCGQKSEPSLLELKNATTTISDMSQSRATIGGLIAGVVILAIVVIII